MNSMDYEIVCVDGTYNITMRSAIWQTLPPMVVTSPGGNIKNSDWRDDEALARLNVTIESSGKVFRREALDSMPALQLLRDAALPDQFPPDVGEHIAPVGGSFATHEVVEVGRGVVVMKMLPGADKHYRQWKHQRHSGEAETSVRIFWVIWMRPTKEALVAS